MKRPVVAFAALVWMCVMTPAPSRGAPPQASQLEAWNQLLSRSSGALRIRWDEEVGCPATIAGTTPSRAPLPAIRSSISSEQAAVIASGFFVENAALFGLRGKTDEMRLTSSKESKGMRHLRFVQTLRGVPVEHAAYTVTLRPDGSLGMVNGRMFRGLELDVAPSVSSERAAEVALNSLKLASVKSPPSAALRVLAQGTAPRLVWAVEVLPDVQPAAWRVLVDAKDARVVAIQDRLMYEGAPHASTSAARPTPRDSQNSETPNDPFIIDDPPGGGGGSTSGCQGPAGNVYATTLCNGTYFSTYLPRLTSTMYTTGSYASVQPVGTRQSSRAVDPTGCQYFPYVPPDPNGPGYDDSGFDDVNLYYQIDKMLYDFWDGRFFYRHRDANGNHIPVQARSHSTPPPPQDTVVHTAFAAFNPLDGMVYFGDGSQTGENTFPPAYDPAKNHLSIYHELTHLVLTELGINSSDSAPFATNAVHEAYADYFAATFAPAPSGGGSGDPTGGTCDFEPPHAATPLRPLNSSSSVYNYTNLSLTHTYPGGVVRDRTYEHTEGMILSGTLWDIRGALGATLADDMAFEVCDYVQPNPSFFDIRDAYYWIDQSQHFGDYHCKIQTAFWLRGMDSQPPAATGPTTVVATDGGCTVVVSWSGSNNEDGHRVYAGGVPISPDLWPGPGSWPVPGAGPVPVLYTVKAFNCRNEAGGSSDWGSTQPAAAAPTGLTASNATVNCGVQLNWNSVAGASQYKLYRGGAWIKDVNAPSTSTTDTQAPQGFSSYTVAAFNCAGSAGQSAAVQGRPAPVLLAPATVSASDGTSETSITITWTAVASATGYRVYRNAEPVAIADLGVGQLTYTDNSAPNGLVTYGVAGYVCSPKQDGPRTTDTGFKKLLVVISGPTSRSSGQSGTWTVTPSGGAAPYTYQWYKYRDCPGAAPSAVVTGSDEMMAPTCWEWIAGGTGTNSFSTSDSYDFRVKCVVTDAGSNTGFAQRNVDIPGSDGEPQAPVSFVSATDGDPTVSKVKVTWGPSDGAEGFRVYRAGTLIATLAQNDRSYVDPVAPNAVSSYCVVAYSGTINSGQVCNTGYPYVPLAGSISGPSTLAYGGTGTYTLSMSSGGIPPLTRQWYYANDCGPIEPAPAAVAGDGTILAPPCGVRYPFGTGGTSINWTGTYDVELSCRVTDAVGRTTQPVKTVDVAGVIANQLTGDREADGSRSGADLPDRTELLAVGNPVAGRTDVNFTLAIPLRVQLSVFDIAGRRVERLADAELPRGRHRVSWNASAHPAGMYLYRFTAGGTTTTRRFMIVH